MTLSLSYKSIAFFVLSMTALGFVIGLSGPRVGSLIAGALSLIAGIVFRISALKETRREQEEREQQVRKIESQEEFAERIQRQAQEKIREREEKQARQPKHKETKPAMKNFELLTAFIAATLNKIPDAWGAPRALSGMEVIQALWPLNEVFRPRMPELVSLPYDKALESAADAAIEAFIGGEGEAAWENLPLGVWRVLSERHTQALVVASANEAAGNPLMTIPEDLPEYAWLCAAMLYLMYQMKLPYPVKPRSLDEFPPPGAPAPRTLH